MRNTVEKIADTALCLFNSQGLPQVTLSKTAREMQISQGNLNYHYKKSEDIIEEIYYRLVTDMDSSMAKMESSKIGLQLIYDISALLMKNLYKYRFFLLDFTQIMRENKTIRTHYRNLIEIRQSQILGLFGMMIKEGLMRAEQLPNEYFHLYKRMQIFGDFWVTSAEIEKTQIEENIIHEYLEMIIQSIYP